MPDLGTFNSLVVQFETDYELMYQQRVSRLRDLVRLKTGVTGTMTSFGIMGLGADPQLITGERHGQSEWHDTPYYRRWAVKDDFIDQQILDEEERMETLVDPQEGYVQNALGAFSRKMDKILIDAATGTAQAGQAGTTAVTFDTGAPDYTGGTGNQIAVGGTGLTLDKMRQARAIFDSREVGLDEISMGDTDNFVWVTNAKGHKDLMDQTEVTSTDYIGVTIVEGREVAKRMPLVGGRIQMMMGFRILISNQLNTTGGNPINLAWHRSSMGLAIWGGRMIRINELPEHRYSIGVTVKEHLGAVRIKDAGVLAIVCLAT